MDAVLMINQMFKIMSTMFFKDGLKFWLKMASAASMLLAALLATMNPAELIADDALFYPQIAEMFLKTGKITFNGYDITNGFHPLQFAIITVLHRIFLGMNRLNLLSIDVLISGLFAIGSVFMLRRILKREHNSGFNIILASGIFAFYICGGTYVSEAQINAIILLSTINMTIGFLECQNPKSTSQISMGMLMGLSVLSRLDNAVPIGFLLVHLIRTRKPLSLVILTLSLVVMPYFLTNLLHFGSIMPISGSLKSTFPIVNNIFNESRPLNMLTLWAFEMIAFYFLRNKTGPVGVTIKTLLISSILLNGYYILFQKASTHSWYHVIGISGLCLAAADFLQILEKYFPKFCFARTCATVFLIVLLPFYVFQKIQTGAYGFAALMGPTSNLKPNNQIRGINIRSLTSTDARILTYDAPGELAYYGERSVTALDGLTLNRAATNQMKENLIQFIADRGISYLALPLTSGCQNEIQVFDFYNRQVLGNLKLKCATAKDLGKDRYYLVEIDR